MENHEPPIVLVPGFLGSDSHWDVEAIRDRYQSSRFLTTHPGPLSSHHDRLRAFLLAQGRRGRLRR